MRRPTTFLRGSAAVLAVLSALGGGVEVAAQEGGGEEEPTLLTLQEALQRASEFNSDYRQALNQLELDGHPRQQWWARIMPNVSLSYRTGLGLDRIPSYVDFEGNPVQVADVSTKRRSNYSQDAGLTLNLDPAQRYYEFRETQAQARRSRISAEQQLNSALSAVQRLYLDAQKQQAQLAVEQSLLADRTLEFEEKQRRFELMASSRSDLLSAELDLENQRISLSTAQGGLEKALLALRTAIGDPELGAIAIEEEPPAPFDPATLNLATLIASAGRESPMIASAQSEVMAQRATLNARKALDWPSISVSTTIGSNAYGQDYGELFALEFDQVAIRASASVSVNVPLVDVLPIFDGFQKSYTVASATMSLRNSEMSLRQTMLRLEESIRSKYTDLQTAWDNVRQRERALQVATERLGIVREEYLLATKGIEELRIAIREEAAARRDEVNQRFEFAAALLSLYEELGIVGQEAGIDLTTEGN